MIKDYLRIIFFQMSIKYLRIKQVHKYARLKNDNWLILEFIWNNFDTFRELIEKNTTHILSEFI